MCPAVLPAGKCPRSSCGCRRRLDVRGGKRVQEQLKAQLGGDVRMGTGTFLPGEAKGTSHPSRDCASRQTPHLGTSGVPAPPARLSPGCRGVQPYRGCIGSHVGGLGGVATGQTLRLVLPWAAPAAFRGQISRQPGMRSVVDALPSLEKRGKNHCPAKGAVRRGGGCGALRVLLLGCEGRSRGAFLPGAWQRMRRAWAGPGFGVEEAKKIVGWVGISPGSSQVLQRPSSREQMHQAPSACPPGCGQGVILGVN